jgi:hypothetical protein
MNGETSDEGMSDERGRREVATMMRMDLTGLTDLERIAGRKNDSGRRDHR